LFGRTALGLFPRPVPRRVLRPMTGGWQKRYGTNAKGGWLLRFVAAHGPDHGFRSNASTLAKAASESLSGSGWSRLVCMLCLETGDTTPRMTAVRVGATPRSVAFPPSVAQRFRPVIVLAGGGLEQLDQVA
jgi:hypothetical protein